MNSNFPYILLLLHVTDSLPLDLYVSCQKDSVCAMKGYKVTLDCIYSNNNIKTVFWFSKKLIANWRNNNEPEDLTLDSDYSGRVKHQITNEQSTLTISDLREKDSGEYQLMFIMKNGVQHLSSVSVSLTVTDLKVKVNPASSDPRDETVKLTCDSSCTFGVQYYWMKDGEYLRYTSSQNMLVLDKRESGRYSCSLENFQHSSPYVCVSQDQCWDVSYSSRRVCALVGSTVDFSCSYSHPSGYTVNKTFWHYGQSKDFKDLREELQFSGRVENEENKLRIKDLKMSDSGEYRFRFITDRIRGKYSGSPGVILTVTDTQVTHSPDIISEGEKVILSCSTKCALSDKHTFIWLKNGRQLTDGFTKLNKLYLDSVSSEELQQYSCAVGEAGFSHYTVTLLVFLPQFLLIAALWMWFFIQNRTYPQNESDVPHPLICCLSIRAVGMMSSCSSIVTSLHNSLNCQQQQQ